MWGFSFCVDTFITAVDARFPFGLNVVRRVTPPPAGHVTAPWWVSSYPEKSSILIVSPSKSSGAKSWPDGSDLPPRFFTVETFR